MGGEGREGASGEVESAVVKDRGERALLGTMVHNGGSRAAPAAEGCEGS